MKTQEQRDKFAAYMKTYRAAVKAGKPVNHREAHLEASKEVLATTPLPEGESSILAVPTDPTNA